MPITRKIETVTSGDVTAGYKDVDQRFIDCIIKAVSLSNATNPFAGQISVSRYPWKAGNPVTTLQTRTPRHHSNRPITWGGELKIPRDEAYVIKGHCYGITAGDKIYLVIWWERR